MIIAHPAKEGIALPLFHRGESAHDLRALERIHNLVIQISELSRPRES